MLLDAPPQDSSIEFTLRTTIEEGVQFVQQLPVRVGAVRRLTTSVRLAENSVNLLQVGNVPCGGRWKRGACQDLRDISLHSAQWDKV